MRVPFFKPAIDEREIEAVVTCLRSGWLTTGPTTRAFEEEFAAHVGAKHAVALNSCTAALHLALEAIGIRRGDLVIVPTLTFAATAEVVRYLDAIPVFVDCDPATRCLDMAATRRTVERLRSGKSVPGVPADAARGHLRAIIPMHYGGLMADVDAVRALAAELSLSVIEDAAHTLPAFTRAHATAPWRSVGTTADVTCFSFYANKCITTGEGGMAVTNDAALAERMRLMSLHGMSKDAWKRFTAGGTWYYEVIAPGFKYNMTDIAAAIGRVQLARSGELWAARRDVARMYQQGLAAIPGIRVPTEQDNRQHSWHLFSISLDLAVWRMGRDRFIDGLKARGIGASVHWMPLHMQPYYRDTYGLVPEDFPVAAGLWPGLVSLPLYPTMTAADVAVVVDAIAEMAAEAR